MVILPNSILFFLKLSHFSEEIHTQCSAKYIGYFLTERIHRFYSQVMYVSFYQTCAGSVVCLSFLLAKKQ